MWPYLANKKSHILEGFHRLFYRVTQKKCLIAFWSSNLFQKYDFTFPHVFWIQNFEPDSSSNSYNTNSGSEVPKKRKRWHNISIWSAVKTLSSLHMNTLPIWYSKPNLCLPAQLSQHHWGTVFVCDCDVSLLITPYFQSRRWILKKINKCEIKVFSLYFI